MKVSLMFSNSDVIVFVGMTGDLGVMVDNRNSPFVSCTPSVQRSFSLTAVYKTSFGATDSVLCARQWPVNLKHWPIPLSTGRLELAPKPLLRAGKIVIYANLR